MSSIGHATSPMLTPMSRFHAPQNSGTKSTKQSREVSGLQISLKRVVGTTTNSVNAFDALPEHHTFVCSAGPAAVLSRVDEHLNITQQLLRARANVLPVNASPSFYNPATPPRTPVKSRHGSLDYQSNSPSQGKATNRSRETSCVCLSRRGDLVAVGETGYNPRVLIYSTTSPSDVPLTVLSDHSFGISSIAFSDDSRWLCTLGNTYDGFILLYSINARTGSAKLVASNKCSNVRRVLWIGDHSVVSIGVRHAKVWRIPRSLSTIRHELDNTDIGSSKSPTPKAFVGRSCSLGPLMDATFTSVASISECRAILCTAQGDICLLDDSQQKQQLEKVAHVDFKILCVAYDHAYQLLWIGGGHGVMRSMHLDTLINPVMPNILPVTTLPVSSIGSNAVPDILAIGFVRSRIITIDSHRITEIRGTVDTKRASVLGSSDSKRLPAHESAVLGVSDLLSKSRADSPEFFTFSARGTVLFWQFDGKHVGSMRIPLDQPICAEDGDINELKIVVPLRSDEHLLSGDKSGVLRLIDRFANEEMALQAHSSDINSIAVTHKEGLTIVATCGRDRTLQLFRKDAIRLDLFQTVDDHAAAVGDVKFLDNTTLLSISSDRTIIVRKCACGEEESIAFLPIRIITLKASPVSLTIVPAEPNVVLVSTLDRQIHRYNVSSGRLLHSFKASDTSGDSVIMSSLEVHQIDHLPTASRVILGVSSTDKSIRIHDYDSGAVLTRGEYGQNAVSAIKLLRSYVEGEPTHDHLISCGLDGTVMIWGLSCKPSGSHGTPNGEDSTLRQTPPSAQPRRRILSKAELSNLQKSLTIESDTMTPMQESSPSRVRRKNSRYNLAAAPKTSASALPSSPSLATAKVQHELSQTHSQNPQSQETTPKSRSKPPSLESRRRSKSAANIDDLNNLGEQLCISLRTFRNRITLSSVAKIEPLALSELATELRLTVEVLEGQQPGHVSG